MPSSSNRRRLLRSLGSTKDLRVVFLFGLVIGAVLAVLVSWLKPRGVEEKSGYSSSSTTRRVPGDFPGAYTNWLSGLEPKLKSFAVDPDVGRYLRNYTDGSDLTSLYAGSEAQFLHSRVPVACLLFPENEVGANTVKETWGRHCNRLYFFSHKLENDTIPIVKTPASSAFALLCNSLRTIYLDDVDIDWVLVTTDNTYALLENLRHYVAPMNKSSHLYVGHAMKFWGQEYNWGDAGYALSRGTLDLLARKFPDKASCEAGGRFWRNGDWYLGKHLASEGVFPVDTRDAEGRGRFNGYTFNKLLFPGGVSLFERYWRDSLYLSPDGPHCCSSRAITFHGILAYTKMYQLEYLFYHLRPFQDGGEVGNRPPKSSENPFFTREEELKDEFLKHLFRNMSKEPDLPVPPPIPDEYT